MEKYISRPKLLILVLGVLLVAGAVTAAVSAGWFNASPVQAQPADASPALDQAAPAAGSDVVDDSFAEPVLPADQPYQDYEGEGGCNHEQQMNPEDL